MTPSKFIQLRKELNGVIDRNEDFVCIIKLVNNSVFGDGSLCAGNVTGEIFKRRLRQLSGISLEMRRK